MYYLIGWGSRFEKLHLMRAFLLLPHPLSKEETRGWTGTVKFEHVSSKH